MGSPSAMKQGAMRRSLPITLVILSFLSSAKAKADDIAYAYCPLGEGYVFLYDTVTGFQVLANLNCGEKVDVVDTHDKERTKVRTATGKEGYVFKYTITTTPFGTEPQAAAPPSVASTRSQHHAASRSQCHRRNHRSQPLTTTSARIEGSFASCTP